MDKEHQNQRPMMALIDEAFKGSGEALETIVLRFQDRIYGLALRMLSHPEDAQDATQEILIKMITHLKTFRFEGAFEAWAYRVAANHLKTVRKSRMERFNISWEKAVQLMDQAASRDWLSDPPAAPSKMLEIEARLRCTQALLTAMDRPHRLAFILGVVMDVSSQDGAFILDISPAAFRKRISRARGHLWHFLSMHCGLFDRTNRCSCPAVLAHHLHNKWIVPDKPVFMGSGHTMPTNATLKECLKELDELGKVATLFKSFPEGPGPRELSEKIKVMVNESRYRVLSPSPWDAGQTEVSVTP